LNAGISALPQAAPAPQFLAGLRRKIRAAEQPAAVSWLDAWLHPAWPNAALAAVAVVLVVGGVYWMTRPVAINRNQATVVMTRLPADEPAFTPLRLRENTPTHILAEPAGTAAVEPMAPPTTSVASAFPTKDLPPPAIQVDLSKALDPISSAHPEVPEMVIVRGEDLVAVQLRASDLARSLNGRLDSATPSNTFTVSLPQSKVSQFRSQMAHTGKRHSSEVYASPATASASSLTGAGTVATTNGTEPVVTVEVVVEPVAPLPPK
jgi:hypothetical protein